MFSVDVLDGPVVHPRHVRPVHLDVEAGGREENVEADASAHGRSGVGGVRRLAPKKKKSEISL